MEEYLAKDWDGGASLGLDYGLMRRQAIEWVQALAGDRWTNYNESDPGVTILEQLCYALTELCFQAEMPVGKLLASPQTQRIQLDRQGLYAAQDILPAPALSLLDQRRWLLDQLPDVANIWLTPLNWPASSPAADAPSRSVAGLYQIDVLPFDKQVAACSCHPADPGDQQRLEQAVRASFSAFRNLGEDVGMVSVLAPVPVGITASLQINTRVHPDQIVADLLFRLGLLLAPEPRRHALEDRLQQGLTTTEIFQGPPLQRGFIAEDQLDPLPLELRWSDVEELIASLSGVLEVDSLSIDIDSQSLLGKADSYQIKTGAYLRLAVDMQASSAPIKMFLAGDSVSCNPARIQRLLERRWHDHRCRFNLEISSELAFPVPVAAAGELGDYGSILTLFPTVYGMGSAGVEPDASPKQQAQVKQLKGYLMIFDQLMADFMAQIAFLPQLFSPSAGDRITYDHRSLAKVPGCDSNLLVSDYDRRQQLLAKRLDQRERRQNAILDFFLSIYGQRLLPGSTNESSSKRGSAALENVLSAKRKLLVDLVGFSRQRGTGVDYRNSGNFAMPTRLERRCLLELQVRREAQDQGPKVTVVCSDQATFGRLLPTDRALLVERSYLPLDGLMARLSKPEGQELKLDPLRGQLVAAELWPALADPSRYRVGQAETGRGVDLVCLDQGGGCWWLGEFDHARLAHAYAHRLLELAVGPVDEMHLIEWVLMRHALDHPSSADLNNKSELFRFRVSAVLPLRKDYEALPMEARETQKLSLTNLLRPHLPAHLELQVHLLASRRWRRFLELRSGWLTSLAGDDAVAKGEASRRLVLMLQDEARQQESHQPDQGGPTKAVVAVNLEAPASPDAADSELAEPEAPKPEAPKQAAQEPATSGSLPPLGQAGLPAGDALAGPTPPAAAMPYTGPIDDGLASQMLALPAATNALGVLCREPLSTDLLNSWRAADVAFLMLPLAAQPGTLASNGEDDVRLALRGGFALMPYYEPPAGPQPPSADLGRSHAIAALGAAAKLRFCKQLVIWLASYPSEQQSGQDQVIDYFQSWAAQVQSQGFGAGLFLAPTTPCRDLRFEWLCQAALDSPAMMLGFSLTLVDQGFPADLLQRGNAVGCRVLKNRSGLTPPWLTLDPRALPVAPWSLSDLAPPR
jgi:hypothetical protein